MFYEIMLFIALLPFFFVGGFANLPCFAILLEKARKPKSGERNRA
jgi:hypothetical protein